MGLGILEAIMYEVNFRNLDVWKKSKELCIFIYKLSNTMPKEETYGMISQIRRAVVSIPSNIAEGYAKSSMKEKLRFIEVSIGSFYELATQIEIAKDINYITEKQYQEFKKYFEEVGRLLGGYRKAVQSKI